MIFLFFYSQRIKMPVKSLFEVPEFMKSSYTIQEIFEEANSYKMGSDEWIEAMKEKIDFQYFAENDNVENLEQFTNLMNVCDLWELPLCPSLFVYYFKNKTDGPLDDKNPEQYFHDKMLYLDGYTYETFKQYVFDVLFNGVTPLDGDYNDIFEKLGDLSENDFGHAKIGRENDFSDNNIKSKVDSEIRHYIHTKFQDYYDNVYYTHDYKNSEYKKLFDTYRKFERFISTYEGNDLSLIGFVPYNKNVEIGEFEPKYTFNISESYDDFVDVSIDRLGRNVCEFRTRLGILLKIRDGLKSNENFKVGTRTDSFDYDGFYLLIYSDDSNSSTNIYLENERLNFVEEIEKFLKKE